MRLRVLLVSEPAGTNLIGLCVAGVSLIRLCGGGVGACVSCCCSVSVLLLVVLVSSVGVGVLVWRCCLCSGACVVCLPVLAPWFLRVEPL